MDFKWRYICKECHTVQNYKVNMSTRYKCKKCKNRSAIVSAYLPTPTVGVFVNFFCPKCNKAQDFRCEEHFKYCPECNYSRPRIEYQREEEIDLNA